MRSSCAICSGQAAIWSLEFNYTWMSLKIQLLLVMWKPRRDQVSRATSGTKLSRAGCDNALLCSVPDTRFDTPGQHKVCAISIIVRRQCWSRNTGVRDAIRDLFGRLWATNIACGGLLAKVKLCFKPNAASALGVGSEKVDRVCLECLLKSFLANDGCALQ